MVLYQRGLPVAFNRHLLIATVQRLQNRLARFTLSQLLSVLLVLFLSVTGVLGCWAQLLPRVYAANLLHLQQAQMQAAQQRNVAPQQTRRNMSVLQPQQNSTSAALIPSSVSASQPFDGLGNLSFYTYVKHPINSSSCSCGKQELLVNAADGNLLLHSVDLQISGTNGLDLQIEGYYNSESSTSHASDHGKKWTLSLGHNIHLDTSDTSSGITLYGPSGDSAYFAYDSSSGNYTDAPGLEATLEAGDNNSYTLTFHKTGVQWIFGADNGSMLSAIQDQNGNKITINYDSTYDVTSITDTQSRATTLQHDTVFGTSHYPQGQITQITDPTGKSVTYTYDSNNNLISTTDLNGYTTTYGYNGNDLISITDARGNITQISYDSHNRVTAITDPLGGVTQFSYSDGETDVTDANGNQSTYDYDSNFKVTKTTDAEGYTHKTSYDVTSYNVTQQTDALGNATTYAYDTVGNVSNVTDANGNKTKYKYDDSNHPYFIQPVPPIHRATLSLTTTTALVI